MVRRWLQRSRELVLPIPALPALRRLTDRIRQEPRGPYRLEELAREHGFSTRGLTRHFQKETGMSFSAYLQTASVIRAAELLTLPGAAVSDVALEVGYLCLGAFSNAFTALLGQRPSAYMRQSHQLENA